jgi:hypothetical protein
VLEYIRSLTGFYLLCYVLQAAYNNEAQFDLNEHSNEGIDSVQHVSTSASKWSIGTKVLKQFDTEWFIGSIQRYDVDDDLYWILYDDGDSEDLDVDEVEQVIANYKSRHAEESIDDVDNVMLLWQHLWTHQRV